MESVKKYIFEQVASQKLSRNQAKTMLSELEELKTGANEDIAVIGMAARVPGARDLDEFWSNLVQGKNCLGDFPEQRKKDSDILVEIMEKKRFGEGANCNLTYRKAGYIDEIDKFDAPFFGITDEEAAWMDPYQRLFLETAWEAVEDAGLGGKRLYGSKTGVFVGRDFAAESIYKELDESRETNGIAGLYTGILASRISYIFNFRGPAMVIDTACSSALVAMHEANLAMKSKRCDLAIVGGIALMYRHTDDNEGVSFVDSKDCTVRTFDKKATGTVWGEGVAAVVLKPLSKAIADRDNIHAVIKACALNNDGASNGILAPNAEAQEELLVSAWKEAGINPETITYIEAHGTGTNLGDPIEVKGMTNAFMRFTDKKQFCGIGSLKTNVGHLQPLSGLASLFKVILSMKHGQIPATINFEQPNPYIRFTESPVYVNDRLSKWERGDTPRRGGISAYGFSGTNAHVVVEEPPAINDVQEPTENIPHILTISAKTEEILKELVVKYKNFIKRETNYKLRDICFTANTGRGHHEHRLALILKDEKDFREKIEKLADMRFETLSEQGIYYGRHAVIPGRKAKSVEYEITEAEQREFSEEANKRVREFVELKDRFQLQDICTQYIKGATVQWDEMYRAVKARRVSIPVYPFERRRYWLKWNNRRKDNAAYGKPVGHPLLDRCIAESLNQDIYMTKLNVANHWVLKDHKVAGTNLLPGTGYLEIARAAGNRYYKDEIIELHGMSFKSPLAVPEGMDKEVQTIITKEDGFLSFAVASKSKIGNDGDEGNWTKHSEAKIYKAERKEVPQYNIDEIRAKCEKSDITLDLSTPAGIFEFGARWIGVKLKEAFSRQNEVLGYLEFDDKFKEDLDKYYLHPSIMDVSVNVTGLNSGEGTYLPASYKLMRIYGPTPAKIWTYGIRRESNNNETQTFDILLMDETGKVFVEIEEYTLKRVRESDLKFRNIPIKEDVFFKSQWNAADIDETVDAPERGSILILKDEKGVGESIAVKYREKGRTVIEVLPGAAFEKNSETSYTVGDSEEDYLKLLEDIKARGLCHIFHLFTIKNKVEIESMEELAQSQKKGVYSLFYTIRSIVKSRIRGEVKVTLISENVNEVTKEEAYLYPYSAALFGLGKVVDQEYPQIMCRCIDIDAATTADQILNELRAKDYTHQVAYRNGKRYIEHLGIMNIKEQPIQEAEIKSEGVYVITGGTGGIGVEMAKYIAQKNTTNIALINRSRMPAREEWEAILESGADERLCSRIKAVQDIEELGANVICCSADVSSFEDMKKVLDDLRANYGRINGVLHSAGVAGDGVLIRKEEEAFRKVMMPKVEGTWILDSLTKVDNPDFFILNSSIMSVFGGPGQGDYTAANSFLDAFAFFRAKSGKKTISINWPAWKETGMAVDHAFNDEAGVFKGMGTEQAMFAFDAILNRDNTRVITGELNYASAIISTDVRLPLKVSEELLEKIEKNKGQQQGADATYSAAEYEPPADETEEKIAEIWLRVLGPELGLSRIGVNDDFFALGGQSVLSIRLESEMEKAGMPIESADLHKNPTVRELANFIKNR
ncbi:MAG: SDR family NAD(P)-dependent oxidoreductase [Clostridia bacterium]|nr:SDR family NAD(P)-dependent oxidoreductase [Clostridia bacterium]